MKLCESTEKSIPHDRERTFIEVHRRLGDECFQKPKVESGIRNTHRTVNNEGNILQMVENTLGISARKINASLQTVNRESIR